MSKYQIGDLVEFDEGNGDFGGSFSDWNWDWKGTAIITDVLQGGKVYTVDVKSVTTGNGKDMYEQEFSEDESYSLTREEIVGLVEPKDD